MSGLFLWLKKFSQPSRERLKAAQVLLDYRGKKRNKTIEGDWQGVLSAWGNSEIDENSSQLQYFTQAGSCIKAETGSDLMLPASLDELEGFWMALSINARTSTVQVARDRFSGMPLYLYNDRENFILSSEIEPIRAALPGSCPISLPRIAGFLSSLLPPCFGEETFFENVLIPQSGKLHSFDLSTGRLNSVTYTSAWPTQPLWSPPVDAKLHRASRDLRYQVAGAVKRCFRASGKLALGLSGGVDSSVLAVELDRQNIPFTPFSVTYPECGYADPDESSRVSLTARQLGLKVRFVDVTGRDVIDRVEEITLAHQEPLSGPGLAAAWKLEKTVSHAGFRFVTSGLGGDTVFSGLPALWLGALFLSNPLLSFHQWHRWHSYVPISGFLGGIATFSSHLTQRILVKLRIAQRSRAPWLRIPVQIPSWYNCHARNYSGYRLCHAIQEVLAVLFSWEERRLAHSGLETIVPFIDLTLMRNLQSIPVSFHHHQGTAKYLVRRAYSPYLPPGVIWNRKKLGFDAPIELWMNGAWQKPFLETILESNPLSEIVDRTWIEKKYKSLPVLLCWRLYTVARFLELFGSVNRSTVGCTH